ncbi:hypothetical protein P171DRAFT_446841 [Karstenula rhodostoma CBS 690.94]|uniref:Uncharacterized protein n=1 Tax=Karstenula rhodostoma CBS 690.94 TaxID=1392251 RepID=A0A9P4P9I5_9PLEO|nr:hypothetical protein P171DRAFT_446841 [Karstenula rhodostoma CBS 690.94]
MELSILGCARKAGITKHITGEYTDSRALCNDVPSPCLYNLYPFGHIMSPKFQESHMLADLVTGQEDKIATARGNNGSLGYWVGFAPPPPANKESCMASTGDWSHTQFFKMHILSLLSAIIALKCVSALPNTLVHRQDNMGMPGAVYTCTEDNFKGECQWTPPTTECHIRMRIKSLGPDIGGYCKTFTSQDCKTGFFEAYVYPGKQTDMSDQWHSFQCYPNQAVMVVPVE